MMQTTTATNTKARRQPAPQHREKVSFVDEADGETSMVSPLERVVECSERELAVHVDRHGYYCEPDRLKSRPRLHAIAIRTGGLAWIFDAELDLYWAGKRQG